MKEFNLTNEINSEYKAMLKKAKFVTIFLFLMVTPRITMSIIPMDSMFGLDRTVWLIMSVVGMFLCGYRQKTNFSDKTLQNIFNNVYKHKTKLW